MRENVEVLCSLKENDAWMAKQIYNIKEEWMGKEKEEDKSYGWNELMGGILRKEVKAMRKMNFVGVN